MHRISSSGQGRPDRFRLDQCPRPVCPGRCGTIWNCNLNCNPETDPDRSQHRDRGCEAARQHELLFGLGQYGVDVGLIFRQAGTLGRVGLRLAPGLRLALGVFSVAGRKPALGVGVPHCLPDSPDEVFELTSRDVEPDPPVWVDPHLALVPAETHPMMELPEPGCSMVVLPRARPAAADGDLQFDQSFAGLVDGADPGDGAGIVAEGIWELTMPFILPAALSEDRKRRSSMINCLGGRERPARTCPCPGQLACGGIRE